MWFNVKKQNSETCTLITSVDMHDVFWAEYTMAALCTSVQQCATVTSAFADLSIETLYMARGKPSLLLL